MKVSIIIPVYNIEAYIIRCLQSVSQQSFTNIECIIVDDCGIDKSIEIAEQFIKTQHGDIFYKIIHHDHNQGLSASRNTGIRAAVGEYVYFLDGDDSITTDCIETLLALFNKYPDIQCAQGNILDEKGVISHYGFKQTIPSYIHDKLSIERYMLCQTMTSAWNRLIRREFLLKHSLFFPVGLVHEDMPWLYYLTKHLTAIAYSSKGLYTYYINSGSIMTSTSRRTIVNRYRSRLTAAYNYMDDMLQHRPSTYRKQFFCTNLTSCLTELYQLSSFSHWIIFWIGVCHISIKCCKKTNWRRCLFFFCLMPPFCFISGRNNIRWRIQNNIINKI